MQEGSFENKSQEAAPERYIVVEDCDEGGGILGYRVMKYAEAKRLNDNPNVPKLPDKMPGALHGSILGKGIYWREFTEGQMMSKEQAEDYARVWNKEGVMTYAEYNVRWSNKS